MTRKRAKKLLMGKYNFSRNEAEIIVRWWHKWHYSYADAFATF